MKKNSAGVSLYDPFTLTVDDYSPAVTVGDLVELAKKNMEPHLRINYKWLLNEIKDHNLPFDLKDDEPLSRIEGLEDKIKIAYTIYGYPAE